MTHDTSLDPADPEPLIQDQTAPSPDTPNPDLPEPEAGIVTASRMQHLSGLEFLMAIAGGELAQPPIAELMDFRLTRVEPGRVVFEGRPGPQHYNPIGTIHGGYAATLLDSVMGCAVHSVLPAGTAYTTLEIKVNFVRALTRDTGLVRAESELIHKGKRVATSEGRLFDANGKLYAHGSTTCLVFPM